MVKAVAVLRGESRVTGTVTFTQVDERSPTTIQYDIKGSEPGLRGFHVHEFGDNTNGCTSAGGHFNPSGVPHGDRTAAVRHVGDLGNLLVDGQGNASGTLSDRQVTLIGPLSVVGRTIVFHGGTDDLGETNHPDSKVNGNAGPRVACGVIGIAKS